jgi:hypothetical protein
MKVVAPLLFGAIVAIALAVRFAPHQWMWPIIGTIAFFAIFISTRIVARLIGEEAERRFNKKD